MTVSEDALGAMLLSNLASPARQAVDPRRSRCTSPQFLGAWLWDAELDSGAKHAKAETAPAKAMRHEAAKTVCRSCSERLACWTAAKNDPEAEGIYGGELFTKAKEAVRGDRQDASGPGLHSPRGVLDEERRLGDAGNAAS